MRIVSIKLKRRKPVLHAAISLHTNTRQQKKNALYFSRLIAFN